MHKGCVTIVLHAHLPYVRHPEQEIFLEERWLFEAISETYIPLLEMFEKLTSEGTDFRLTMSMTPPLLSMLSDKILCERYVSYLNKLIELTEKELARTENQPEYNRLARLYNIKYKNDLVSFTEKYSCNLIESFKKYKSSGKLEIMASAATHGLLPLLSPNPESIKAQVGVGADSYQNFFGGRARGIWLPECGYTPVVESILRKNDIEYFITEAHGLLFADPKPVYGTYSPIVTPNGVVVFGRDIESSKQVWSSKEGYPGDLYYREFYRDIGYDLDFDYIKDYISPDGQRINTGIKYYRITGDANHKQPYIPELAMSRAVEHARHFVESRERQILGMSDKMHNPPIVVCPYDAELFGHWWYEGPYWLYNVIKIIGREQENFQLVNLGEYLDEYPVMQVASPCASSWGSKGYNEVWLNSTNDWIYRHLHKAADRMVELAARNHAANGLRQRALNQAARELLLAQSSDWAFIMRTGTTVQYAERRIKDHIGRFTKLYSDIVENSIDETWLSEIEHRDNIFPEIDFRVYTGS